MALEKTDLLTMLTEIQDSTNEDLSSYISELVSSRYIPVSVIDKIVEYKPLDIVNFYKKLKSSYNDKHSKLYINIMKIAEHTVDDPQTILTTISALLNQIFQFPAQDTVMFYKHCRLDEIIEVLNIYSKTFDISFIYKLIGLIKADIKYLEMMSK